MQEAGAADVIREGQLDADRLSAVVYVDLRAVDEDHLGRRRSHHATQTRSKSVRSVTGRPWR